MNKLWEIGGIFMVTVPGLAIGFKACQAAAEKIGIGVSVMKKCLCY